MRINCLICRRSKRACFCEFARTFSAGFSLILIAHPREARNTVGTVRMAHLSVKDSVLIVSAGKDLDQDPRFLDILAQDGTEFYVLFPGPESQLLEEMSPNDLPKGKKMGLIVIDGTWMQAKQMVKESQLLTGLPRVSFTPDQPSGYRFRKQPFPHCLSTVEAVHAVIERLDKAGICPAPASRAHDGMLSLFQRMVEFQLSEVRDSRT